MGRNKRALSFPRQFSVMLGVLTGKVIDVLRVLASTRESRASNADITRELILKGMAVLAAEHATTFTTRRPVDLTTDLLDWVCVAMGEEFIAGLPAHTPDEVLHAVLSHMWPEVVQAAYPLDTRKPKDAAKLRRLIGGPPRTREGRALTGPEIRAQALAELVAGQVQAPQFTPPRTVQQAREQARLATQADRLAMERGVSAASLLAGTAAGAAAGLRPPDESPAALGYIAPPGETGVRGSKPRAGATEQPSLGAQLKAARAQSGQKP